MDILLKERIGGKNKTAVFSRCQVGASRHFWAVWRSERDALAAAKPYAASCTDTRECADWAARMVADAELYCPIPKRLLEDVAEAVRGQHDELIQVEETEDRPRLGNGRGVSKKTITNSLRSQRAWMKKQLRSRPTRDNGFHAHNIMVGAVQSIN